MWYDWAEEFRAGEKRRKDRQGDDESGEAPPAVPEVSPTHGLIQGDLVYVKRRPSNTLDTEYKGPYRVVSEDAAV